MKPTGDSGIYAITSPSGKQYIGQARSIAIRWINHRWALKAGKHHCRGLQNAWNKYGKDALVFSVLAHVPISDLNKHEQAEIDARPRHMLYNAATLVRTPMLGRKHAKATRQLMSDQRRGENHPNWGKKRDPETLARMSAARVGRKLSAQHIANMSAALKGKYTGDQHPMYGRKHTPEALAKISARSKGERNPNWGKKMSDEHRAKLSAALTGRVMGSPSEAHRRAISIAKQNMSPERKEEIAAKFRGANNPSARAIRCIETGMEFDTGVQVEEWLRANGKPKASRSAICRVCGGQGSKAYGYMWEYVNKDGK